MQMVAATPPPSAHIKAGSIHAKHMSTFKDPPYTIQVKHMQSCMVFCEDATLTDRNQAYAALPLSITDPFIEATSIH